MAVVSRTDGFSEPSNRVLSPAADRLAKAKAALREHEDKLIHIRHLVDGRSIHGDKNTLDALQRFLYGDPFSGGSHAERGVGNYGG